MMKRHLKLYAGPVMVNKRFSVVWERNALDRLGKLFNVDHEKVYTRSKLILSLNYYSDPIHVAEYSGFGFNGYSWVLIHNVIIIYRVSEERETVFVEACYFANTELSHEIFWGIDPNM